MLSAEVLFQSDLALLVDEAGLGRTVGALVRLIPPGPRCLHPQRLLSGHPMGAGGEDGSEVSGKLTGAS